MIKLLWVGDAVTQTGFARVTHSVLDELVKTGDYDVSVLGVNYFGDPHGYEYNIWPARRGVDVLGYERLLPLIEIVEPDIIVLFNDLWVVAKYVEKLLQNKYSGKVMTYFPVDSDGYSEDWVQHLYKLDKVLVYTEYAKQVLREANYLGDCVVVPHGIDRNVFFPIPQEEARHSLEGLNDTDFIVFNGNRNQPRKRIDITVKAFMKFAKDKPDARLYLHMGLQDIGWNLVDLFHREAKKNGITDDPWKRLILTDPNLGPGSSVPVSTLNVIYNVADVGLNTSLGEGWGLVNFEQAACGVAQIVPNHSACPELFRGRGLLVDTFYTMTNTQINTEGHLVHEDDVANALQTYYWNAELRKQHAADMYDYIRRPEFEWSNIAQRWDRLIKETLEE